MPLTHRSGFAAIAGLFGLAAIAFFWLGPVGANAQAESTVTIESGAQTHTFTVEVADDDESRAQGLMFRDSLAPDAGMLFDFFEERPVSFWMQNTLIPLDMLFIEADGTIARIHDSAVPMDTTGIPSGQPVRFVLEIPGGRAEELGIEAGDVARNPRMSEAGE